MASRKLTFPNGRGEALSALLDLPTGAPKGCVLFAHCFTCSKNFKAVNHISRALTATGLGVLRFDFTGLGESEGDFADTNFSSNGADLVAAAGYMAETVGEPRLLVGHSLGGAAVLQAASRIPSASGIVTIGAPAEPSPVLKLLTGALGAIEAEGEVEVDLAGRRFQIRRQFLDDLEGRSMAQTIRNMRKALLIFHSPLDETVGIDNAAMIFEAARHPKSFVSLDRADHLLTGPRDSKYVGSVIGAWAARYLDPEEAAETAPARSEHGVRVEIGRDHYRAAVQAGDHSLVADEPGSAGGTDLGPTPYEYLSAALGSCTVITLRMYADRKQWPLDRIAVEIEHNRIHAGDCRDCAKQEGLVDVLKRRLELTGALSQEQRARLAEIADRCPVHRTLENEIVVRTEVLTAE